MYLCDLLNRQKNKQNSVLNVGGYGKFEREII